MRRFNACVACLIGPLLFMHVNTALADSATTQPETLRSLTASPSPKSDNGQIDLTSLSLEDLMNVTVNSVSKSDQNISQSAAAVTVISQEQIQRSGLITLTDILRLAPGMDVAQINASTSAVSARGFNSQFADKLLVLMDGRTIYDPLTNGVIWNSQDYMLADLDKIEVIRGPGATLWGSNAVNGVVNITTKSARDTQGLLFDGIAGYQQSDVSLRYGGAIGDDTFYRIYGLFRDTADSTDFDGSKFNDGWQSTRGGFRVDKYLTPDTTFTFQGDVNINDLARTDIPDSARIPPIGNSENLLARLAGNQSQSTGYALQVYFDNFLTSGPSFGYHRETGDVNFQQRFPLGSFQELTYGLGARFERGSTDTSKPVYLQNGSLDEYITSGFLQDDVTLVPDRFHMIIGSKFEQSSYAKFQVQPSARLLYTPNERNTLWSSVSRAVRSPGLLDLGEVNPFGALGADGTVSVGNPHLKPEEELAYEIGYRSKLSDNFTLDAAAFYNDYKHLTADVLIPNGNTTIINAGNGHTYGLELAGDLKITPNWQLQASYSLLLSHATAHLGAVLDDNDNVSASPTNQIQLHSYMNLTKHLQFNASAYYVDAIPTVKSYTRLDLGLDWRSDNGFVIGIDGQNLLQQRHTEFGNGEPVSRSLYAHIAYTF
jgi:iron complex outermembrane receptor protein